LPAKYWDHRSHKSRQVLLVTLLFFNHCTLIYLQ
jgi:hypothetical protein